MARLTAEQLKERQDQGIGQGNMKPEWIVAVKKWVSQQVDPMKIRLDKIENRLFSLDNALRKVEKRLDSQDMRSQSIIDKIDAEKAAVNSTIVGVRKLIEQVKADVKVVSNLANSNKTGIESVSASIEVSSNELKDLSGKTQELKSRITVGLTNVNNMANQINQRVTMLNDSVSKNFAIHNAFKEEVLKRNAYVDQQISNFTNEMESYASKITKNVNDLNQLSTDFSNHVGDYKTHVKSVETFNADFRSYQNAHRQVHAKQDADFANTKVLLNKSIADFNDHIIDYSLHKKPIKRRIAELSSKSKKGQQLQAQKVEEGVLKVLSIFRRKK